jgi:hypothetical protein
MVKPTLPVGFHLKLITAWEFVRPKKKPPDQDYCHRDLEFSRHIHLKIQCVRKLAVRLGYGTLQCIVIAHARLMS